MNVTATDKGTSKNARITITNNKGRLSKEEIDKLVKDAEKYKDQDQKIRRKVEAKNGLESYCLNVKHAVNDEKLQGKIAEEDKRKIMSKISDIESWISNH